MVHSGKPGVKFDTDAVEQALTDQIRLMDFEPYEVSTDVTAAPAIDVDKIAADIIGDPVNATVSKKDGKTTLPARQAYRSTLTRPERSSVTARRRPTPFR